MLMPAMYLFLNEIGLSQGEIGTSQALFTLGLCVLNIPTGWLADRFSRRLCNAVGDVVVAVSFFCYPLATSFLEVVAFEILMGIGFAFSNGADYGLLRAYCQLLKRDYHKETSFLTMLKPIVGTLSYIVAGLIAAKSPGAAIIVAGIPFIVGAVISLFIKEVGEHREKSGSIGRAIADMYRMVKYALHDRKDLARIIVIAALGQSLLRPSSILVFTPALLIVGIPVSLHGIGWALLALPTSIGAWMSRRASHWSETKQFVAPTIIAVGALTVLLTGVSAWTIGSFALIGVASGWIYAVTPTLVQKHAPDDMQSTVMSVAVTLSQLAYVIAVASVGFIANFGIQWALLANVVLYIPLLLILTFTGSKMKLKSH
jgi:MFS family permease